MQIIWSRPLHLFQELNPKLLAPALPCFPPSWGASKTLQLGQGTTVVLTLASIRLSIWKCNLDIEARPGLGLIVRVKKGRLTQERFGKCVDYVVPVFIWYKSVKLCGDMTGYRATMSPLLVCVSLGEWGGSTICSSAWWSPSIGRRTART